MISPGVFRFFLATLVVIHHSFPLRLGAWAVGLFFVLSGYWISRMWRQKYAAQASPYAGFLLSRWWRIAPLFFAVHLLAAGLIAMGVAGGSQTLLNDPVWWLTQPAVAGSTQFGRLLPPAWSLDVEMQFYFLAPLLMAGMLMLKTRGLTLLALGSPPGVPCGS
ncbi:MAG: acyltransferase family protein [Planctomycetota bacterium]